MQEDNYIEFKSSFSDAVIESLVAFSNTHGGKVLIGVDDNGNPLKNFSIGNETLQKWVNEIKNKTQPSVIPNVETIELQGILVGELSVKEFPIKPVSFKGRYFKRVRNSNHQLSINEISELHLKSYNSSWDNFINPKYSVGNISLEKVQKFITKCNKDKEITIEDDPLIVLNKFELNDDHNITNACFLLFSKQDVFSSTIELGRFSTSTSIKDAITLRTDLFSEVEEVLAFIRKHISKEYIITGNAQREERWQYPMQSIREIVINMIVHRNYMSAADSSIKIYDNHIEFFNPGKLSSGISINQLISGDYVSNVRNKKIAAIFKEAQLIEKYGSGIKRIQQGFLTYGLKLPLFEDIQDGFRVTVYTKPEIIKESKLGERLGGKLGRKLGERLGRKLGRNLSKNQTLIIQAMFENNKITLAELASTLGISQTAVEKNIKTLQNLNLITRVGFTKGGHWLVNN